jgi:hypothetical protein
MRVGPAAPFLTDPTDKVIRKYAPSADAVTRRTRRQFFRSQLAWPDFHESAIRGVNRLTGTLAGAGLMTIALALVRPGPALLAGLLLLAIWGCLAFMRVNYAPFVVCATMYVVLLFSNLGLPEPEVAWHRAQATLAGAAVAFLASLFRRALTAPLLTGEPAGGRGRRPQR